MSESRWRNLIEGVGVIAIVTSLIFVGLELKQGREAAIAGAYDATTEGWRELNYARMNADWYWEIIGKLNQNLDEAEPQFDIPIATKRKWLQALESLAPEEHGRFKSFHLQEKNEAERLYDLYELGLVLEKDRNAALGLIYLRAPLWSALFNISDRSKFGRLVIEHSEKSSE